MGSENGWEPLHAGPDLLEWIVVPGTAVHLQVMKGWPSAIMRAYAADYNALIEPLRDADSASFTATNSVSTSNHLNGTAMDLNWDSHPFRVDNAGYNPQMIKSMREMLAFYTYKGVQMVWWAEDWNSPKDAMHHQMGYNTFNNPVVGEFISRFIRADGYSTFRRGNDVVPPVPGDAVDVLMRATGVSHDKAVAILPTVVAGLRLSECTNVNRIAMWLAQMGHESASFVYTEEIAKNGRYAPYIGRTWIQITWDYNYRSFSEWCFEKGLVPTPDYFVQNYRELADQRWAGIGPAWYWTVSRPQINSLSDARDLTAVTQAINGGQNGAADRKNRYDRALALGDQLLALTTDAPVGDDELSAEAERKIDVIYQEFTKGFDSRSPLRYLDQKAHYKDGHVDTAVGFLLNVDGMTHVQYCEVLAGYGHPPTLALLREVASASNDPGRYPDRQDDAKLAQAILSRVGKPAEQPVAVADVAPQIQYVDRPVITPPQYTATTGSLVGQAYDALAALQQHSAELPAEARAPIGDLINILKGNLA